MPIYQPALNRLAQAPMSGEGTANIFDVIAKQIEAMGAVSGEFKLDWVPPGEIVPEGVMMPEIILRLTPHHKPAGEPDDGDRVDS